MKTLNGTFFRVDIKDINQYKSLKDFIGINYFFSNILSMEKIIDENDNKDHIYISIDNSLLNSLLNNKNKKINFYNLKWQYIGWNPGGEIYYNWYIGMNYKYSGNLNIILRNEKLIKIKNLIK